MTEQPFRPRQMDDDPLRPWNPAEWRRIPVKRPPLPKAPRGVVPTALGITLAFVAFLAIAFIIGLCVWIVWWSLTVQVSS